jgi:segregation and condensation protein A
MTRKAARPDLRVVVDNSQEQDAEAAGKSVSPEQVEMPFAIVNGEAITQLPKDLYIPPQALEVFLDAFEGPLDLLLYMIRRQNLDILDIPIADITKQYMEYIGLMADMQLELAGEYLVMAATLAEIKSRMLLPRAVDPNAGLESDPRADLVRRLQEYERFKSAAENIDRIPRMDRDTWVGSAELGERKSSRPLPQIAMQEMLLAFRDVVQRAEMFAHHHVQRERLSVRVRMSDILANLERASFVEFVNLFKPEEGRMGVTVTFVAILELVREGLIEIVQTEAYAPLHVRKGEGQRGLKLAVDNDAQLDAAANEANIEGGATEYVDEDDADDAGQTDGEQHD